MSCSDENRRPFTASEASEEKRSGSTMSVGGLGYEVSDRVDPGFMVRDLGFNSSSPADRIAGLLLSHW